MFRPKNMLYLCVRIRVLGSHLSEQEHHAIARALMKRGLIEYLWSCQIQKSEGLVHGVTVWNSVCLSVWVGGMATRPCLLLIPAKNTPRVARPMLCNMLYDDLQPCPPSMAPRNGPWPSTCWCIYGAAGTTTLLQHCYYCLYVKLVHHLEVATSFGEGRLHSDTEGAVIIWLPILVFWGHCFELLWNCAKEIKVSWQR